MRKEISVQEWLPFCEILEKGILKVKDNSFVKILKISPINYNLKSELEKEAILNSYKLFLKTCNFNIQIIIQSKKENLNQITSKIKNQIKEEENSKIKEFSDNYINYIKKLNIQRKSSAKKFFLIIKEYKKEPNKAYEELNDKFIKIKENLNRCGNDVEEIETKKEMEEILMTFINRRLNEI